MNSIKSFSLLVVGSLLSTVVLAQNATPQVATENDLKPAMAKPATANIPAPGTRVVIPTPPEVAQPGQQLKPVALEAPQAAMAAPSPLNRIDDATAIEVTKAEKLKAIAIPSVDAMQAKMTEQQKATMAGKTVRPKMVDQSTGLTEAKLTPAKPIAATPVVAPAIIEN